MEPTTTQLSFDFTITVSAILAICALISPIITAIINNIHHTKIRKMELEYDEKSRKTNLLHEAITRQSDIYYSDKKSAFSAFLKAAGDFTCDKQDLNNYALLHSAIDNVLLFCNVKNQTLIREFLIYVDTKAFKIGYNAKDLSEYSEYVNNISLSLAKELESSKPVIEYECTKD